MLDFTPDLARLSAKQFMAVLKGDYQVQALVIGYDHRFGHNRSEDFDDYVRYGQELGMEVILAQAYSNNEMTVSSSAIRHLLLEEMFRKQPTVWAIIFSERYGCKRLSCGA